MSLNFEEERSCSEEIELAADESAKVELVPRQKEHFETRQFISTIEALVESLVRQAPPDLQKQIRCFWQVSATLPVMPLSSAKSMEQPEERQLIIPDGCMEIVVEFALPSRRVDASGFVLSEARGVVAGQLDEVLRLETESSFGAFGMRFHPWASHSFVQFSPPELLGQTVSLADVFGSDGERLEQQLTYAHGFPARVALAEAFLRKHLRNPLKSAGAHTDWMPWAVGEILNKPGQFDLNRLSADMLVSGRQIQRRFKQEVGLSPKRLAMLARFRMAVDAMTNARHLPPDSRYTSFTQIALQAGYFDQAHFIKECKALTGMTPSALLRVLGPLSLEISSV